MWKMVMIIWYGQAASKGSFNDSRVSESKVNDWKKHCSKALITCIFVPKILHLLVLVIASTNKLLPC